MEQYDRAERIADYLRKNIPLIPDTAFVLGSGLGDFAHTMERLAVIPYADIPGSPVSTVAGHKGRLILGKCSEKPVLVMQGRFHRYEGYDAQDVTLYVRVFALLGIRTLILTNAAGAINTEFNPGEFMIIKDHLSFFCPSPLFGKNDDRFGPRFPSMSQAYDRKLIELAAESARECGLTVRQGVYVYSQGPMFETPAEIRALRVLGADACGMSTVPEVIVANHCGMRVLAISCLTNMAAGILDQPLTHEEVITTGRKAETDFRMLMSSIFKKI